MAFLTVAEKTDSSAGPTPRRRSWAMNARNFPDSRASVSDNKRGFGIGWHHIQVHQNLLGAEP